MTTLFEQGQQAFKDGKAYEDCPYSWTKEPAWASKWADGWCAAEWDNYPVSVNNPEQAHAQAYKAAITPNQPTKQGNNVAITTNIEYEITDTYCGEANYSWVRRGIVNSKEGEEYTDAAAIRRVKKAIGWNGVRCEVENYGGAITLRPKTLNQICFITFHSFGSAS